ncbi:hypothetical protein BpHYR1_036507 [Brachionus plicatilis]|uniref:Uncharacterized protein n=1 Tax=Brachionus plicatilis TaxID=10195 RepID=A0A3M7RNL3_BRAPC|nr:hypothetical protein BpHYR1_036507 [Brachionus plicatilis]
MCLCVCWMRMGEYRGIICNPLWINGIITKIPKGSRLDNSKKSNSKYRFFVLVDAVGCKKDVNERKRERERENCSFKSRYD